MQFTPQQLAGYKGYSSGVLVGNWSEDAQVQEDKLRLHQTVKLQKGGVTNYMLQNIPLSPPNASDNCLRYGDIVCLKSLSAQPCPALAIDTTDRLRPKMNHVCVTAMACPPRSDNKQPTAAVARTAWVVQRPPVASGSSSAGSQQQQQDQLVRYGVPVRLANVYGSEQGHYALYSERAAVTNQSRGGKQPVSARLGHSPECLFSFEPASADAARLDGAAIDIAEQLIIKHTMTNTPLMVDKRAVIATSFGGEPEVVCHLDREQATKKAVATVSTNLWCLALAPPGTPFKKFEMPLTATILERVKAKIRQRAGGRGVKGLTRTLRIMDDDHNASLSRREFKEGMEVYGVPMDTAELDAVFTQFDRNGDGSISVTEFLREIRGTMNSRRQALVDKAFLSLDKDGSGVCTFEELRTIYQATLQANPLVKSGQLSERDALKDFTSAWDRDGDVNITKSEFSEYYNDISCSIDNDDYFELMIRNAWHMSGGEGWCENTSNKRVLVIHNDETQEVVELTDDLGLDVGDMRAVLAKLKQQGVVDIKKVELSSGA